MDDSDPFERYFRPRHGGQSAADGGAGDGGGPEDDEAVDGVAVENTRTPRQTVGRKRGGGHRGGGPATRVGPRAVRATRRKRRTLIVSAAMSGVVLASSGVAWAFQGYVTGNIKKVDPFEGLGSRPDTGPKGAMNILIAGVDRRDGMSPEQLDRMHLGRETGTRSDTLMLVHLSANHDKVTIVNLPRDSLVTIPAHESNGSEGARGTRIPDRPGKLTWSYQFGGPALTVKTIERTTGVRVHHYVEVNFLGFVKMVDALGGVTVCTEQPINDRRSGLQLPAGRNHLDGLHGLAFTRARYSLTGGSDLSRIGRQQQFIAAMMQRALSTSMLTDPVKFTKFLNASLETVRADPDLAKNLNALARQMKGLSTDSVVFADVPLADPDYVASINGSAQSTVLWDGRAAGTLFNQIKEDEPVISPAPATPQPSPSGKPALTVPPERITVRVLNGVGTPGVARRAAGQLHKAGFVPIVVPGTADEIGQRTTVIEYGPARADSARTLAAAIPGARPKRVAALGSRIEVIVGSSWTRVKKVKIAPRATTAPAPTGGQGVQARTATQKICK